MLTITWQPWEDAPATATGYNLANLGGSDETAPNWPAFLTPYAAEWHPHLEAVREAIIAQRIWAGGDWHQESAHGMPVVSSGHFWSGGWRAWGALLAAVWNTELGERFTYSDFYISGPRLPLKPTAPPPHTPAAGTTPLGQN